MLYLHFTSSKARCGYYLANTMAQRDPSQHHRKGYKKKRPVVYRGGEAGPRAAGMEAGSRGEALAPQCASFHPHRLTKAFGAPAQLLGRAGDIGAREIFLLPSRGTSA